MLTLILIVALIILLVSVLVAALRRHDANNYFDQERDPFYAEPARLAAAGLLYEQRDKEGRPQRTYTVTPAGEAALRAWLREPTNDPGMLKLYFAGLVAPTDVLDLGRSRREVHLARLSEYERIEQLLVNRPEWRYALATARMGAEFERRAIEFWEEKISRQATEMPPRGPSETRVGVLQGRVSTRGEPATGGAADGDGESGRGAAGDGSDPNADRDGARSGGRSP